MVAALEKVKHFHDNWKQQVDAVSCWCREEGLCWVEGVCTAREL